MFKKLMLITILFNVSPGCSQDLRAEYEECLMNDIKYQDCCLKIHFKAMQDSIDAIDNETRDAINKQMGKDLARCKDRFLTKYCVMIKDLLEQ